MDPLEPTNTILRTPVPITGGRGRGRGIMRNTPSPIGRNTVDTRRVRPLSSPIRPEEIEEEVPVALPRAPRFRSEEEEFEAGVPAPENISGVQVALIMSRLDEMERRFREMFETSEPSEDLRSRESLPVGRRDSRRDTIFTEGGTAISQGKPKMEKPETYNGEYTVLYSVLNWLRSVRKYLKPHNIPKEQYPQYAYTYMGKNVKAWYDGRFEAIEDPHWELFEQAIKERYLPEDHVIQVTKKYENIIQTGSLMDYVEKWQSLMVAVNAAGIMRTEKDHVIQFVTGLSKMEDRKSILDKDPQKLEDVYKAVTKIRHYSLLAHKYSRTGTEDHGYRTREGKTRSEEKRYRAREEKTHLKLLQGAEKEQAFRDGRCIGCGKKGHFLVNCDATKKQLRVMERFEKATFQAGAKGTPKKGIRKGVRFHLTEIGEESETDYDSEPELGDPENESGTENEGEDKEEDSGNESPGPQGGDH